MTGENFMLKDLDKYRYVHSKSEEISKFAREMSRNGVGTEHIIRIFLAGLMKM